MPVHPKQVCFAAGSSGQSIRATIVEYNTTTGAYDAVDISTATGLQLVFKTPTADGAKEIVKTATLINAGTDGKMGYTVDADLFSAVKNPRIVGVWRYKPKLVLGTWTGSAVEWSSFRVVE
jgi:hypothetical protein